MSELGNDVASASPDEIRAFSLPVIRRLYEEVFYHNVRQARFLVELQMMLRAPCDTYIMDYRGLPLAHLRALYHKMSPAPEKPSILCNAKEKKFVQDTTSDLWKAVKDLDLEDDKALFAIVQRLILMLDVEGNGLPARVFPCNIWYKVFDAEIVNLKRASKVQDAILNMFKLSDPNSPNSDLAMLYGCCRSRMYCAARLYFFDRIFHNEEEVIHAVMSLPMKELQSRTMRREVGPLLQVLLEGKPWANLRLQMSFAETFVLRGPILEQTSNSLTFMVEADVKLIVEVGRNPCVSEGTIPNGTEYEFVLISSHERYPLLSVLVAVVEKIQLTIRGKEHVYIAYDSQFAEATALLSACVLFAAGTEHSTDAMYMQGVHYRCEDVRSDRFYVQLANFEFAFRDGDDSESNEPDSDSSSVAANAPTGSGEQGLIEEQNLSPAIGEQESEAGSNRDSNSQLPSHGERPDEASSGPEGHTGS